MQVQPALTLTTGYSPWGQLQGTQLTHRWPGASAQLGILGANASLLPWREQMYDSKANGLKRLLGMKNCLPEGKPSCGSCEKDQAVLVFPSRSWGKGRPSDFSVATVFPVVCSFFVLVAFRCAICCGERMLDFGGCVWPGWLVSYLIPSTSFMPSTFVRSASAVYKTMICKSCGWNERGVVRCGVSVCPEMFEDWLDMTWLENTVAISTKKNVYLHNLQDSKMILWPKVLIEKS